MVTYLVVVEKEDIEMVSHELFHVVAHKVDCNLKDNYCQEKYAYMMGELLKQVYEK